VPIVTIKTFKVPVAMSGAVLSHVVGAWPTLSYAGVQSALPQNSNPVTTTKVAFAMPPRVVANAQPLAVKAAWLPIDVRKQYAHKTRVNVGGDGASGPHPEREPA
jgi:hypothetical protein